MQRSFLIPAVRVRVDRLPVDWETSLQGVCMGQELTVESIVKDPGKRALFRRMNDG